MNVPRTNRSRRLAVAVLAVAVAALLGAFAAAAAQAANYVALGDSYVAGPLIPNPVLPLGCLKSDHNYPHLAAPGIGLALRDPSCSGATTVDMANPQSIEIDGPNPPQLNSIDASTEVVSLTIGGNDIGFSEVAESCITLNPFSHPCKDKYDPGGHDILAERIEETAPKVATVLEEIHARSPAADVYVVNYPAIFPPSGYGCWPQMPIAWADVPFLRQTEQGLDAMLASEAATHGATLVDWYAASIGHDACKSSGTRWVEPLIPNNWAAPIHPNERGMQGAANALVAAVE
jgi:lysophospholipase L1-like esterase